MANNRELVLLSVIVLIQWNPSLEQRPKTKILLFQRAEAGFNSDYLSKYYVAVSSDHRSFDSELVFIKDVLDPFWMKLIISVKAAANSGYHAIFNHNVDVCGLLGKAGQAKQKIAYNWIDNFFKYSDMPPVCPIRKGTYVWRNSTVDNSSIPLFVTPGFYRISLINFAKKSLRKSIQLTNTTMYVHIKMK